MLNPRRLLLWQLAVRLSYHVATASLCLGGSDIFARVRENSPKGQFIANLSISGDPGGSTIRLCLSGENADWLFLEGKTIRLNSSHSKVLDREVLGSILLADLTCYEDGIMQSQYRIVVEILNENDNKPQFMEKTVQPLYISELSAVNSVVFTTKATDADGDIISYIIDKSLLDASYFRIDLPNSGNVLLDKPLDYESKTQLQLVIYAVETNTEEKYNTTATLTLHVMDDDDLYPRFLPCTSASSNLQFPICTNPIYKANITEKDQDMTLQFSPGPIHAEDGDIGLNTPLTYTILSGADDGRFVIDNQTGEIVLTRPVDNKQLTPMFTLRIMAAQLNDPRKHSMTTALVVVLADNSFPPFFNRTTYKGFVIQSASPATIISTYGSQVLLVQTIDWDFDDGVNPNVHYALHPLSASEGLYHITREGVLIARTDRLRAFDRHILEVVARDDESGEQAMASLDIEVLQRGQPVPGGPFREEHLFGDVDTRVAGGIATILLLLFLAASFLLFQWVRRRRGRRDPHPNVGTAGQSAGQLQDDTSSANESAIGECQHPHSGGLHGRQGVYIRKQSLPPPLLYFPKGDQEERSSRPLSGIPLVSAPSKPPPVDSTSASWSVPGGLGLTPTNVGAVCHGAGYAKPSVVLPQAEAMTRIKTAEARVTEQDIENPYRTMHAVICDSDEDEDVRKEDNKLCRS